MAKKKPAPAEKPAAPPAAGIVIRDRIVGFERIKASDLKANPQNWRMHPESQRGALTGMMQKVGNVSAILARIVPGGHEILDGHLRQDIAGDALVPVLITDLNDEEAKMVLATYDPLAAMAVTDNATLEKLLEGLDFDDNAELRRLMSDTLDKVFAETDGGELGQHEVPGMNLQPHEHYDYILVLASTAQDWNLLLDKLGMKPEKRRGRMGTARGIRAPVLLKLLDKAAK